MLLIFLILSTLLSVLNAVPVSSEAGNDVGSELYPRQILDLIKCTEGGGHCYSNLNENPGWVRKGALGCLKSYGYPGHRAVYQLYQVHGGDRTSPSGRYFYSADHAEIDRLTDCDPRAAGACWTVAAVIGHTSSLGSLLHQYFNAALNDHYYTLDAGFTAPGWVPVAMATPVRLVPCNDMWQHQFILYERA